MFNIMLKFVGKGDQERGNKSSDQNVLNFVFSRTFLREKLSVFYREYSTQIAERFSL